MKKIIVLLVILILSSSNYSLASKILVVVDGEAITSHDVEKRLESLKKLNRGAMPDDEKVRHQILKTLINEKLYIQETKRNDIKIDDNELKDKLIEVKEANPSLAIDDESMKSQIKAQILWAKLINMKLRPRVAISESEIEEAAKFISTQDEDSKISLKQMVIPAEKFIKEKMVELRANINNCNDVDKFAKHLGISKPELITTHIRDLNESLKAVVASLPIGKPSEFMSFDNTKLLVVVCSKSEPKAVKIDKEQAKEILTEKKLALLAKNYLDNVIKKTYIEYHN